MAATQLRHFKLWFAGKLRNWDLAAYELTQIKASLEDATTLYQGIPTTNMDIVAKPLQSIGDAIEAKNSTMFAKAFGDLTTACNGCHQANGRGFIVVKVPTASPFSNQSFRRHQAIRAPAGLSPHDHFGGVGEGTETAGWLASSRTAITAK